MTSNDQQSVMEDIQAEIEKVPNYLTKHNESFRQLMQQTKSTMTTTTAVNIDALRKASILIYKIMVIQTYHLLWTTYLRSGQGKLIGTSNQTTVALWPKEMKIFLPQNNTKNQTDDNESYLSLASRQWHELDRQLQQNQIELNTKMTETYVEKNLRSFRMGIEHRIALINYDYYIRALKTRIFSTSFQCLSSMLIFDERNIFQGSI